MRRRIKKQDDGLEKLRKIEAETRRRVVEENERLSSTDYAWEELEELARCIHESETVSPLTLQLLAKAIESSRRDPAKFLQGLGIKRGRGKHENDASDTAELLWGRRLAMLEDGDGLEPAEAMKLVLDECDSKYRCDTLRGWRDEYRGLMVRAKESTGK